MKRKSKLLMATMLLLLLLAGCNQSSGGNSNSGAKTVYTVIALPNDGGEMGTGTEAIIEELNIALEPYNAEVEYQSADDYSVVSEAILSGTAHISTSSGATYVKARMENDKIIPIFTEAPEGKLELAGYPAYIATNKVHEGDFAGISGEEALKKLAGKSFSFVSATSTSGRVVPTTTFWEIFGPDGTGDVTEKSAIFEKSQNQGGIFSEVQFSGSHPANVELLVNDKIYAAAFCCEYGEEYKDDLYIIYEQQVAGDPFWLNSETVAKEHLDAIVEHFTSLTPETATSKNLFAPEGQQVTDEGDYAVANRDRFVKVSPEYYDFLQKMFEDEM